MINIYICKLLLVVGILSCDFSNYMCNVHGPLSSMITRPGKRTNSYGKPTIFNR